MKRYRLLIVFAAAMSISVSGFGSAAFAAEVLFVKGSVQAQSQNDEEWRKVDKGTQLNIGDTVRTARHSAVEIALDAEKLNVIKLGDRTLAVLNSANADTIDRLELARGRVYSNMEGIKAGMDFEVTTPSAVAGVRGSSYMVYSEPDQDEISAYKDTVFLRAYDAGKNLIMDTMLPQGFKTFIERFSAPSAMMQISLREFSRFDAIRSDLVNRSEGREPVRERERRSPIGDNRSVIEKLTEQAIDQKAVTETVTDTKDLIQDSNTQQQIIDRTTDTHEYVEEHEEYNPYH